MTLLELPVMAIIGVVGTVGGAGGAWAVTKSKIAQNEKAIENVDAELEDHKKRDEELFRKIAESLGRIEGKLDTL
jgi:hypothetical protein